MTMSKPTVTFTAEEEKILTAHDAAAHDLMRVESRDKGEVSPCWLVCSDEIRAEYRRRVIDVAAGAGGLKVLVAEPTALFERLVPKHLVEAWRAAELAAKEDREAGNPRAFFAS
jgi:hypothetical protein